MAEAPLVDERRELATTWRHLATTFRGMLGEVAGHRLEIEREEHQALIALLQSDAPSSQVLTVVESWVHASAARRLEQLADHGRAVAERLGKGPVEITVDAGRVRFDADRFREVTGALVHVVRNAIDHGLESHEDRRRAGKDETGHITLRAHQDDHAVILEVEDDGAGIDWERLADKARARGLSCETEEDRQDLLFADGVTSRDEVTSTAGRGVGLSALRAACRSVGGRIEVRSERGAGTCFVISLPHGLPTGGERSGVFPAAARRVAG